MATVTTVEEWSTFADGSEYFSKTWHQRGSLKATVLFIHGLGEHIERYDHVFPAFAAQGIRVLGWDQRGFGRTGRRGNAILGHNGGAEQALADIAQVDARARSKDVPHFVMGHSMGGGLALKYVSGAIAKGGIDGLIASAPLVEPGSKTKPSIIEYYAVLALSKVLRTVVMDNHVDEKELSRDPVAVKAYLDDPLVHTYGSLQTLASIVLMGEGLLSEDYKKISLPTLITHGDKDTQTSPQGSKKFYDLIPAKDKEYILYPGYFHELHNEPEQDRAKVIKAYVDWILSQISKKK